MTNLELLRQGVGRVLASETQKVLPRLVAGALLRLIGIGIALFPSPLGFLQGVPDPLCPLLHKLG